MATPVAMPQIQKGLWGIQAEPCASDKSLLTQKR